MRYCRQAVHERVNLLIKTNCLTATWQFLCLVLFVMLYMVVLFKSVDETLVCDYSNESY